MNYYHANLHLTVLTEQQHRRTCNYWFTITSDGMAHIAFTARAGVLNWLRERGLSLTSPLTEAGTHSTQAITGSYHERSHLTPDEVIEFNHHLSPVIVTATLSNGEYTLAKITEADGVRTVHTLNPNVRNRVVFDYREASSKINPGYFK